MANKVYEYVTERILAELDKGIIPWRRPWKSVTASGLPISWVTKKAYRGVNRILLPAGEYLTYKQVTEHGGKVLKGEKGHMVVFYKMMDIKDQDTDEEKSFPYLRYYTVFEVGQCEGIERKTAPVATEEQELPPIGRAEAIVAKYPEPPRIRHEGNEAYYTPVLDIVTMPIKKAFESAEEYYSTLFHELAHSTGHKSRLGRDMATTVGMRSDSYAKEELVAEIASAMLCGMSGIENSTIENSVAYIQSWRRRLEQDPKLIVMASSQAQKASDYILGEIPAKNS